MATAHPEEGEARRGTPIHLWIVGILALLWNLMGAWDYLATQLELEFYMSKFTEEQLNYFYSYPAWTVAGWATAVWVSVVASVGLLLRKKWALWAFVISFVGLLVSSLYTLVLTNGLEVMGSAGAIFTVIIYVIEIGLILYSWFLIKKGVLS